MTARKGAKTAPPRATKGATKGARKDAAKGAKQAGGKGGTTASPPAARSWSLPRVVRAEGERRYWLLKTEPDVFSFDDLRRAPGATTYWDGVRNFQARNYLRDELRLGDGVLIYHSGIDEPAIAGIAEVVREGYPDHTAFDPDDAHFDPKSDRSSPTWMMVDVRAVAPVNEPISLGTLRATPSLADMILLQRGSRLSVQPVSASEWETITRMAGITA